MVTEISESGSVPELRLPSAIFEQLLAEALEPLAEVDKHPEAFYQGMRLIGIDGTRFSIANTPSIKRTTRKAKSRRGRAAFPQLNAAVLVELGLHNPVGAIMGAPEDSEMSLARQLWTHMPKDGLLIADRYYGAGEVLAAIPVGEGQGYLVKVRSTLKPKHLQQLPDRSALVEVQSTHGRWWCGNCEGRSGAGKVRRPTCGSGRAWSMAAGLPRLS